MQTSIPSLRYFADPYLLLRHSLLVNLLFLLLLYHTILSLPHNHFVNIP